MISRLRRILGRALKWLFFKVGVYGLLRRMSPSPYPAILRFHSVAGREGLTYASRGIIVSPRAFNSMIRYLSRRYRIATMDQIAGFLSTGVALPANTLVVTFDDGYRDNVDAASTLARYGWRATIYLTAGCLGDASELWLVEVRRRLLWTPREILRLHWRGQSMVLTLRSQDDRERAIAALTRWIKSLTVAEREDFRSVLARAAPIAPQRTHDATVMMRWDEARTLAAAGTSLGAHTLTHCNLVSALDTEARHEVEACLRLMERELSAPPRHFAYPDGGADAYADDRAMAIVRAAGFSTAVTSRAGRVRPRSDPMTLPRFAVTDSLSALVHDLEWDKARALLKPPRPIPEPGVQDV